MKHIKLFENFDRSSIDDICKKYNITNYTINEDDSIDVDGNVNISNRDLIELPIKFKYVHGDFLCSFNRFSSLLGFPEYVGGDFDCMSNELTTLEGCPSEIRGNFSCNNNKLTSLQHFPYIIGNNIDISFNNLTSFDNYLPTEINGDFECSNNRLSNLKGSPESIGSLLNIENNNITSFHWMPKKVKGSIALRGNNIQSIKYLEECDFDNIYGDTYVELLYDIFKDHLKDYDEAMDIISKFDDFNIVTNLDMNVKTINLKRLNKFIDFYDLNELTDSQIDTIKNDFDVL